jgi:molybdopterin/thiamine biosynthesis adenylyltransferase
MDDKDCRCEREAVTRVVMSRDVWSKFILANQEFAREGAAVHRWVLLGTLDGHQQEDVFLVTGFGGSGPGGIAVTLPNTLTADEVTRDPSWFPREHQREPFVEAFWDGSADSLPSLRGWSPDGEQLDRTVDLTVFDPRSDVYSRVEGIFETRKLAGKTVTIVGVGSLGSFCCEDLVRCGVDSFRLVDHDRLEPHNVVRHACDLRDLGRHKTRALADLIQRVNPSATVECLEVDVLAEPEAARKVIEGSSIVLVCTDGNPSRLLLNELCLELGVPAVYGGAYERAFGGHVFRVIPGQTPCFECVIGGVLASLGTLPEPQKGRVAYLGAENQRDFVAEPGLGLDVRFIALIQAKMALLTLLRGEETTLEDFPSDLVFWGNRKEWIFPGPLYSQFARMKFRDGCSACAGRTTQFDVDGEAARAEGPRRFAANKSSERRGQGGAGS